MHRFDLPGYYYALQLALAMDPDIGDCDDRQLAHAILNAALGLLSPAKQRAYAARIKCPTTRDWILANVSEHTKEP